MAFILLFLLSLTTPCQTEDSHRCIHPDGTLVLWHQADLTENDNAPTFQLAGRASNPAPSPIQPEQLSSPTLPPPSATPTPQQLPIQWRDSIDILTVPVNGICPPDFTLSTDATLCEDER